ncbi:pentatricopeptide repeat-containing protein At1g52640, mitochondrial [Silene latifolia]|uniref:pentatricopeptide repeat-containing protein At1g52640, mitochondrial n=1 Tax=Silene latifolia TaxID=37657 RepID=UPI003D76A5C7
MLGKTISLSRNRATSTLLFRIFSSPFSSPSTPPPPPLSSHQEINEISRILSDFRRPHHDIEQALSPFSSKLSTDLVHQVLKRSKNLGFSAHRFFLWAKKFPDFEPDIDSYKILVNVLGGTKQFPLIWDLLSEMKQCESFDLRPEIFWVIFDAYCRANLPNDAIRAFDRMSDFGVEQSVNDVEHLLYLLCRRKFVSNGQEFFDKVKGKFDVGVKSYTILVRGWGEIGDSENARKVFDEMLERGLAVDVPAYNGLLEALCNGGELDEAYAMFREMGSKGLTPDAFTYSIFIRSYCKRDNVHSVLRVLDRMKRYNLVPNVFTYNCIIKRLCANEKIEEAYQLLEEMIEAEVIPDSWSYNAIMAFHCDRTEVNRALKLYSKMEQGNCKPDRHTYNMLLKMLIRIGRFDKVEEVWDSMPVRGFYPSVSTYAVMIHGFLKKKNKLEEACKYFETMIDEGIPPYPSTLELLRNRLIGWGILDKIEILADKMNRSSSSTIKDMSMTMRGHRSSRKRIEQDNSELSEEEWPFRPDAT